MDLYDRPANFFPEIPGPLARAARVWCLGGILWMGAGLFLLLLSFLRTGPCVEWGVFCAAMSPGILLQAAVAFLIYGWGLPMMWGLALLRSGRTEGADPSWIRAGAWGWHGAVLGGGIAVLCGRGSGLSVMPFPAAVWPVLVMAVVPVFFLLVRILLKGTETQCCGERLPLMTAILGFFYLIGGTVSVFFAGLPPYYRTLAAECTTFGLATGVLLAFAMLLLLPERRSKGKYEWAYVVSWAVFVAMQPFLFIGLRHGMKDGWFFLVQSLSGFLGAMVLLSLSLDVLKLKWRSGYRWIAIGTILWGMWYIFEPSASASGETGERAGFWLVYLILLLMGFFAVFSSLFLYVKVPYIVGRDWLSRRALVYPLWCWMAGAFLYYVGMFVATGWSSREFVSVYWTAQAWVGIFSVLLMLAGWAIFVVHVALVWAGRGRIAYQRLWDVGVPGPFAEETDEEKGSPAR